MMERAKTAKYVTVWVISAMLAAAFLIAGIPKLIGGETWVQVFALEGYPAWFRRVVGLVEVAGALFLVVPRTAMLAAVALGLVMLGAIFTQLTGGAGALSVLVPVLLLAMLAFVAWARSPLGMGEYHPHLQRRAHPIIREAVIAGVIGATAVAIWFLIVDAVAGRPFFTPQTLGRGLFSVLGAPPDGESPVVHVVAYTIFHYAAFIGVGAILSAVVHAAEREPSILIGFVILFVVFEIGFHALVALLQERTALREFAWYQVMAGNLIAAVLMGAYLWHVHPELKSEFQHALDGTD